MHSLAYHCDFFVCIDKWILYLLVFKKDFTYNRPIFIFISFQSTVLHARGFADGFLLYHFYMYFNYLQFVIYFIGHVQPTGMSFLLFYMYI